MADDKMSSNRPYLMRAVYEWIIDNQCTPHLLVDVQDERVKVPQEHIRDGQIVLNINPSAVGQFHWDNDHIEFTARFAGVARTMWIPITSVLAIYARENGEGMAFTIESDPDEKSESVASDTRPPPLVSVVAPDDEPPMPPPPNIGRGHLKVVK